MRAIRQFFRATALWLLLTPGVISTLGAASNQLVLFANHDRFPVSLNIAKLEHWVDPDNAIQSPDGVWMIDDIHCVMTPKTHLNLLADIFDFHEDIESIGDLLLGFGESIATFCYIAWFVFAILKLCSLTPKQPAASPIPAVLHGPSVTPDWMQVKTIPLCSPCLTSDPPHVASTESDPL